jgi:hypothetical protein
MIGIFGPPSAAMISGTVLLWPAMKIVSPAGRARISLTNSAVFFASTWVTETPSLSAKGFTVCCVRLYCVA